MPDHIQAFRDAIRAAGLAPPEQVIDDGKRHRFATSNRRGDVAGWYILHGDGIPAGAFGDWRGSFSQSWCSRDRDTLSRTEREDMRARMALLQAARNAAQAQTWAAAAIKNRALWATCSRLAAGDVVHQYLAGRGIDLAALPGGPPACIRVHPALPYFDPGQTTGPSIGNFPAMVAAIVSPAGKCIGLHRTYLAHGPGGKVTKASVASAKKMTRLSAPMTGACIPLAGMGLHGTAGIAEGIETALACTLATGIPTLAAISAGGLARWEWPFDDQGGPLLSELLIFADNDASGTGQKAAQELAGRALAAGIRTQTLTPTTTGTDWADVFANSTTTSAVAKHAETRTNAEDQEEGAEKYRQKYRQNEK